MSVDQLLTPEEAFASHLNTPPIVRAVGVMCSQCFQTANGDLHIAMPLAVHYALLLAARHPHVAGEMLEMLAIGNPSLDKSMLEAVNNMVAALEQAP